MRTLLTGLLLSGLLAGGEIGLEKLRDRQDRAGLEKAAASLQADAEKSPNDADKWYRAAIAYSYIAEVTYELRDKAASEKAAEAGVKDADKAIALNGKNADYFRVLGTLCGQVIPANPIMGALAYGKRAKDALEQAIQMDPKSASARVAHGVGFYYLPASFGGGPDNAIKDYQEAIRLIENYKTNNDDSNFNLNFNDFEKNSELEDYFFDILKKGFSYTYSIEILISKLNEYIDIQSEINKFYNHHIIIIKLFVYSLIIDYNMNIIKTHNVLKDISFLKFNDLIKNINELVITDYKWLNMLYYIINFKYFKNENEKEFIDDCLNINDRNYDRYNYNSHINVKIIEKLFDSYGKYLFYLRYFK